MNLNKYAWQWTCVSVERGVFVALFREREWMAIHEDVIWIILFEKNKMRLGGARDMEWKRIKRVEIYLFIFVFTLVDGRFIRTSHRRYHFHIEITVGITYFENRTIVVVTIDRTILHGRLSKLLERRHCSKSTVGGIVRTVKWWIAVGIKSWRELVLTESWIRTSGQKPTRVGEIRFSCHVAPFW